MKLSVLILTHNRIEISKLCITKIVSNIGKIDHEILIWDNCSNDGTFDWLCEYEKMYPNISVFGSDKNIGIEAINNLAQEAKGEYLLKIDDDILVPRDFAARLVKAYEKSEEPKLGFLGFDMLWNKQTTFATRSGLHLYKEPMGKTIKLKGNEKVYIHYRPHKWMVNGACRLCKKDFFEKIGGHPKGAFYGVDHRVSSAAETNGFWIGFYHTGDPITHIGWACSSELRAKKNAELKKLGAPLHV